MNKTHPLLVIAGGGFLSRETSRRFAVAGWTVRVLTRDPTGTAPEAEAVPWDGLTHGPWKAVLTGADALINFCGRSVNCRYHGANRRAILESRLSTTRLLGEAVRASPRPPPVWLNAASATIYRHAEDRPMDEATGEIGHGFSVDVCQAWEEAATRDLDPRVRQVLLRTSMVLGHGDNSVYPVLARLARFGLGGTLGNGNQFVSWIHVDDFCRALAFLIRHPLEGPVNVTAPEPVTNRELMRTLRESLDRRFGLPANRQMLEIGAFLLRTETELTLKSRRVDPRRLREAGFSWRYPRIGDALRALAEKRSDTPLPVSLHAWQNKRHAGY